MEIMFDILDPARTAAGYHRQSNRCSGKFLLQSLQKLGSFLHDRKIGSEICVENITESQSSQCCSNFACYRCARRQTEFFTKRNSYSRSDLYNDSLGLVIYRIPYLGYRITFFQSTYRTNYCTLSAENTIYIRKR